VCLLCFEQNVYVFFWCKLLLAFVWPAAGGLAVELRLSRAGFKGCLQISSERVYMHCLQYDYIALIFIL